MEGNELISSSPLHRSLINTGPSDDDDDGGGGGGVLFFDRDEREMALPAPAALEKKTSSHGGDDGDDDHGTVSPRWRVRLGVLYMCGMAMCSVVLCALGATLDTLAAHCGLNALSLSSVYIARGAGAVCGAMASSSIYRVVHGNHALALALAFLAIVLLALPPTTSPVLLHVLFALLGLATSTIDTGVQIMTRKAHGAGAGPWLGANTLAFGVAGAAVPVVSLMAGGRDSVVYLVFAAFSIATGAVILCLAVPQRMAEAVDGHAGKTQSGKTQTQQSRAMLARRKGFAPPSASLPASMSVSGGGDSPWASYAVEAAIAVAAFFVIGGQVALTS